MPTAPEPLLTEEDRNEIRRRILATSQDPELAKWVSEVRKAIADGTIEEWR